MTSEHPAHWRPPPSDDTQLRWRWLEAEAALGISSTFDALAAMAARGPGGNGTVQTDDRLVKRGVVRLRHDGTGGEGAAERLRRIDSALSKLSQFDQRVLWHAFGPVEARPQAKDRLGRWCGVSMVIPEALRRFQRAPRKSSTLAEWLKHDADKDDLNAIVEAIEVAVFVAWNRWADARGRRQRVERRSPEELAAYLGDEK